MIVVSNVERSQLKFFRPKGHVEDSLQNYRYILLRLFRKSQENASRTTGRQARSKRRSAYTMEKRRSKEREDDPGQDLNFISSCNQNPLNAR